MEGRTNWNDSFPETFDLNQGSPDNYVDSPVESRLSNHVLALHDRSIRCTTPTNHPQTNRGWDHGESSSTGNNVQGQTLDDDSKMMFACTTSFPVNHRANHQKLGENNCHSGLGGGRPHTLYESGHVGTEETMVRYASSSNLGTSSCSSSTSIENNDASGPSFSTSGSSCKRKALEGCSGSGHYYPGGTSNSNQPTENIVQHPIPARCSASGNLSISSSADHLEELDSRSGVGIGRVCSGRFTSSRVNGIAQNPVRNFPSSSSPGNREPVPFDASRGPSVGHSTLYASQSQSRPISNLNPLESMSPMTLPLNLNNTLNEPFVHVNEAGPTHFHPWNGSLSSRRGSSSSSLLLSGERGCRAHEEVNFRSSVRNIPASDTINIFEDQIDWSFTPGTSVSSRNYSSSLISPGSGVRSSSTAWLPHGNQTSRDQWRLFEDVNWIPFPSSESDSGSQRIPSAPFHLASASSNERAAPSHARHQSDRRPSSFLMDARGDNTNGRNVLAAVEGRHRLIRHVLSAMRRGTHLRDEDYMFIDPFVNGFAELHDQHMDMRLDVDNMSYEELLALEERIGYVNTGLSEEKIRGCMKKRKYEAVKTSQATEPCCICREDYVGGDDIGILDCGHEFHARCIEQWLILKNICPVCKNTALET